MNPKKDGMLTGRKLEWFHHSSLPDWGYKEEQTDTFALLHPRMEAEQEKYPLYVVFHSAGHDVYSTVACTWQEGNHDIYHAPANMYALYLDCRCHEERDWWWGGNSAWNERGGERGGAGKQPVENRCIATIEWVMEHYPIDRSRVYAVGNSMGGSGALGVAMCRGDIFAAVKVNVPASVRHMVDRFGFERDGEDYRRYPDPPMLVDYSAQNDEWSAGHGYFYRAMQQHKYAVQGFWGNFGHENNHQEIAKFNDLVHALDVFSIRKDEAYPVFTDADSDDSLPWSEKEEIVSEEAGQMNAFFRWGTAVETEREVSVPLRLLTPEEWPSRVAFPEKVTADVTMRRLQQCRFLPGETVDWFFRDSCGQVVADEQGLVTVPGLTITREAAQLVLKR